MSKREYNFIYVISLAIVVAFGGLTYGTLLNNSRLHLERTQLGVPHNRKSQFVGQRQYLYCDV